jgi:hypothetical protein
MHPKRPVVTTILVLSFVLIASGALNAPIGLAQAGTSAGQADLAQQQAHGDQSRPKPSPDKLHLASLSNGGFEDGPDGSWTEYSYQGQSLIVNSANLPTGKTPHSGSWAVWLGGANPYDETAYISQTVDVPASHPVLSFWEWIDSEDFCSYQYDFGTISIDDTWVTSFLLCSSENTYGWVKRTLNLDAYAGQTVELQFRVKTDVSFGSSLFIDDVTIEERSLDHSVYLPIALGNGCSGYSYFDGFGAPSGEWYPGVDGKTTRAYLNGEYQIRFEDWNLSSFVTPDLVIPSSNYRVEADMRNDLVNPGDYGLRFGVHWYYNSADDAWDMDQTYQVLVNPNTQMYFVNKLTGGNWPTLRDWTYSGAIHPNGATNHLRVDRIGTSIRIYINGTALPALTDTSFTSSERDAGIVAYSYDYFPVDMRFDNFHASTCVQ